MNQATITPTMLAHIGTTMPLTTKVHPNISLRRWIAPTTKKITFVTLI